MVNRKAVAELLHYTCYLIQDYLKWTKNSLLAKIRPYQMLSLVYWEPLQKLDWTRSINAIWPSSVGISVALLLLIFSSIKVNRRILSHKHKIILRTRWTRLIMTAFVLLRLKTSSKADPTPFDNQLLHRATLRLCLAWKRVAHLIKPIWTYCRSLAWQQNNKNQKEYYYNRHWMNWMIVF